MKLKMNPVFRKDALAGSRGYSLPLMVTALNFLLVLLFLCNLFFVSSESAETGEIAYTAFLRGCHIIAYAELVLLLLAAPALAAVSVLSERENRTLPVLLTTTLRPSEIILGKYLNCAVSVGTLMLGSFPVLAAGFLYGGITVEETLFFLSGTVLLVLYALAAGTAAACVFRSTAAVMTAAYSGIFLSFSAGALVYYMCEKSGNGLAYLHPAALSVLSVLTLLLIGLSIYRIGPVRPGRRAKDET